MTTRFVSPCFMAMGIAASSLAGPLNPPAGPVAETGRFGPRIEINATNTPGDPDSTFRIAAPGSYYLAENLIGEVNKNGIEIASGDVTIDLLGCTVAGSAGSFSGIVVDGAGFRNVTLRNGIVTDWPGNGVDLRSVNASGGLVEFVVASDNAGVGIRSAIGGIARSCTAARNLTGIFVSDGALAHDCVATDNGSTGIATGSGSEIRNCVMRANPQGASLNERSRITGCTISTSTAIGILFSSRSTVIGNHVDGSGTAGFWTLGIGSHIEGNFATFNATGFLLGANANFMVHNTATANSTNYNVVAGTFGYVVQGVFSPAYSGSSGGVSIGTTDPWANIAY